MSATIDRPPEDRHEEAVIAGDGEWCRAMRAAHDGDADPIAVFDAIDAAHAGDPPAPPAPPAPPERE